jgi:peroxiredoxin
MGRQRLTSDAVAVHSRTAGIGQAAPDFTLVDQDGHEFHLAEAAAAGPLVLVFLRGFA